MTEALLQLEHVFQSYGAGVRRFTAVENVNLNLSVGEFVALLGPSGCGKSTLLRIIAGLQKATQGKVLYRGQQLEGVNPHTSIIFQTFALFPWLTVLENVSLALKAKGVEKHERDKKAEDLLDRVGLDGFESAYPRELSGGMRQKVGFARAMAVEPELLCMDEPFSALDVLSAESLRGELLELWTEGKIPTKAILMVSHNIEEAVFLADRIVVMDKEPGRIIAEHKIDLPHPRNRKSVEFQNHVDQVYAVLAGQTRPEKEELGTAPGEVGITRHLPEVEISDLAGLLENLAEGGNQKHDIYLLEDKLGITSDQLLKLTEAAELLGFSSIAKGDIELTALGQAFADASILARKEIFASCVRRIPLMRWLLSMLHSAEDRRLKIEVILTALSLDFSTEEAEKQIEVLIKWGRYGELFVYDDDQEMIELEEGR
ncbi:MAG TPA: nitrate/sulfonate/bicarbonate ABC transporter ATP-binding protein [Anaerolineaceae bacterium]|jgi:NitT/TauT family transport system ATP-binding protein|nr:AAA-associated domain-containing protein [Anaerolineaceae bacterium]HNS07646.1 nitrate/sulfonate/bicarbonate ABC transporter ATP-binding protein [Anaerolineaceae bacterium]HOQ68491.1 nitrate/sulfonate/bicarbonate ABC transporter ATP-binding protein [Anaerolineaceae bacterium]HOS53988.1 nitrate/sulfonate/bicarbonate ABC transporter ATP-binding protein [Anaerolineaceae bacterium]HPD62273.1 nitrate/sulfonate/bicarbonate ABC transporter ATP-binding protein [Anaerolineaceae bacterium]